MTSEEFDSLDDFLGRFVAPESGRYEVSSALGGGMTVRKVPPEEVLSTREIVKRMLENALANAEAPDYRRALIDVLMYDDQHQELREKYGYDSAVIHVSEPGRYEIGGDLSHRLRIRKVDEYPGTESGGPCCGGGCQS